MGMFADLYEPDPRYYDDDDDFEWQSTQRRPRSAPQPKTCMRCGKRGLSWVHTGERWALQEHIGRLHICDTAASPDEF